MHWSSGWDGSFWSDMLWQRMLKERCGSCSEKWDHGEAQTICAERAGASGTTFKLRWWNAWETYLNDEWWAWYRIFDGTLKANHVGPASSYSPIYPETRGVFRKETSTPITSTKIARRDHVIKDCLFHIGLERREGWTELSMQSMRKNQGNGILTMQAF